MIDLCYPAREDTQALLKFETENRAFFENWVTARNSDYYTLESVQRAIEAAQLEIAADAAYQYLVKSDGIIVRRVNLSGVKRAYYNRAALGYRIGEQFSGRGFASDAVRQVIGKARTTMKLWRIESTVRAANPASACVLERNGFVAFGTSVRSMYFGEVWQDVIHNERHLQT